MNTKEAIELRQKRDMLISSMTIAQILNSCSSVYEQKWILTQAQKIIEIRDTYKDSESSLISNLDNISS